MPPSRFYFWRGGSAADPKIKSIGGEEGEKISKKKFELSTGYSHSIKKILLAKIFTCDKFLLPCSRHTHGGGRSPHT